MENKKKWEEIIEKSGKILSSFITPKRLTLFLGIVYILSLIPLAIISVYNYPSADDFTNTYETHQAWLQTKSVFAVFAEAFFRMCDEWMTWRGSFLASFLSALSPNLWGEKIYIITPWIALPTLSIGTGYFLYVVFERLLKADKYISRSAIALILLVMVQCTMGGVEAFYWYSGAINYTFTHAVSMFFYGLLISLLLRTEKKNTGTLITASILGFLLGGGNQMTMLNVAIVMSVIVLLKGWKKNKKIWIPLACFAVGFVLNISAPGNFVRASGASGMNPLKAIMVSFHYCLEYCIDQWTDWPVVLLLVALIPLLGRIVRNADFSFRYPLMVIFFGYCMVSAMMTPPLFAVGNIGAGRLQALTFTMYILVLVLCEGYVIGWLQKKINKNQQEDRFHFTLNEIWCLTGCILFFAGAAMLTIIPEPHYFTSSSAITDLVNGSAKKYGEEQNERTELYHSGRKDIRVAPFEEQPVLLYFSDVKKDPEEWENRGVCRFYGLDTVRILEE